MLLMAFTSKLVPSMCYLLTQMAFTSKLVPGMCYLLTHVSILSQSIPLLLSFVAGSVWKKNKFSSILHTLGKHDRVFRNFYCVGTNHMRDQSKKTIAFTVNK